MHEPLSSQNTCKVFGYRQLSYLFITLITVQKNGFYFKKKFHPWHEIERINIWQETYGYSYDDPMASQMRNAFAPRAEITLKSGRILFINGVNLEKKNSRLEKSFLTAFDELVYDLRMHKKNQPPKFPISFN